MSKKIFLSPSNQGNNAYAYGNTTEAVVCGEIAKSTEKALKRCGFDVKTMQNETCQERCKAANAWGADLYIPIHTNACNGQVTGTRIFVYKMSGEAYEAAKDIFNELAPITPGMSENISTYPQLIELNSPKAPAIYLEVDFHDVPSVAKWLIENTERIGETICKGVCKHFGVKYVEPGNAPEKPVEPEAEAQEWTELPEHHDTAKAGTYKVNADAGLWLRVGPDTAHKALVLLPAGTVIKCLGGYAGVWLRVETADSRVGFCHGDYLERMEDGE